MTDDAQLTTAISARIILPLDEAAGALSLPSSELARLTRIRDIAFIEFQGQLLFRIEALRDWAQPRAPGLHLPHHWNRGPSND
jgi:hypothetical protein